MVDCFYQLKFHPYQRPFCHPLYTSHGVWRVREGIIVEINDAMNRLGRGEIAPLPWFGSETIAEALQFCRQLGNAVNKVDIIHIPDNLPACQFAFESALTDLENYSTTKTKYPSLNYAYLLPAGDDALTAWQTLTKQNDYSDNRITFKWKIGVQSLTKEIRIGKKLLQLLPTKAKLRLDANGGLTIQKAEEWLKLAAQTDKIEFIEQPLPPQQFTQMLTLSKDYSTPLALDESVANLNQLEKCVQKGWEGIFVIKPAIAGKPSRLRQFCQQYSLDLVFSSVFETEIGRQAALELAAELGNPNRAVGFGIDSWFKN
ncbi:MAG: o-succinylbenzoate synthase [Xenococcaceae cyanobacterium MO_188.B29]|nr:o-succinylbenzoate synthase [Xenococcaceae cyanobacterium MO_188.B29]